ncbi:YchJ family metal-binding protein [Nocardia sp. NPDC052254]|uniref:YchJ family protein n=1 Tax=Nocardia sp. NPDC052254 TaxID=3155681 RepID=UPI00341F5044
MADTVTDRPGDSDRCPCGSGEQFGGCCGPRLDDSSPAPTAEALMRSRYTAFAIGDRDHLLRSWHPRTRPRHLSLDPDQRWLSLQIFGTEAGGLFDDAGTVEFRAIYRIHGRRAVLTECSRFARVNGRWLYVDGDIES